VSEPCIGCRAQTIDTIALDFTDDVRCYLLGPHRNYVWTALDASTLFELATADVRKWIAELEEE
jgi:hypothetical protein